MNTWLIFGISLMIIGMILVMLSLRSSRSAGIILIGPIPIIISNKPYIFMFIIIIVILLLVILR